MKICFQLSNGRTSGELTFLSVGESNNEYHKHLHMFKDDSGKPFFPLYTSKSKIGETAMIWPDDVPFDGILVAFLSVDDVTYKINYSLKDEIVITGKELKRTMHAEIEDFKKNNAELLQGIDSKN